MDYRSLNAVTPQLQCQIPMLDDMQSKIGNAFVTPWDNFKFRVLPFGLNNAPALFQTIMVRVLRNCCDFATVYKDDILVFIAL